MSSKNGSSPDPDPAELVRSIEATRESLAETVDAIAEKVSPKRVADRTRTRVLAAVKDGTASVQAGVEVLKDRVAGGPPEPPAPPARPMDGGSQRVLPPTAPVVVPPLDLGAGGPEQAGEPPVVAPGPAELPVRPEVLGAALAAVALLLVVLRRRRAARRRRTGLAALLER